MDDIRTTLATLESNESAAQSRRDATRRDSVKRAWREFAARGGDADVQGGGPGTNIGFA